MGNSLISGLIAANLAGGLAILAVLALRLPARALFGARAAYALWLVVPVTAAASLLPARTVFQPAEPHPVGIQALDGIAAVATGPGFAELLPILWLAGVLAWLARLAIAQRRAVARFGRIIPDLSAPGLGHAANPSVGPALIGMIRPVLVLPADFQSRFGERERTLVLAHEAAHLAAGHVWINGLIALTRAACWFNPLVHLAAAIAGIDQELACDEAVMRRFPDERRAYAQALIKTQHDAVTAPLGCAWPVRSPNLLLERVEMLTRDAPGRLRLGGGLVIVLTTATGAGFAAWASQPPRVVMAPARAVSAPAVTGALKPAVAHKAPSSRSVRAIDAAPAKGPDPVLLASVTPTAPAFTVSLPAPVRDTRQSATGFVLLGVPQSADGPVVAVSYGADYVPGARAGLPDLAPLAQLPKGAGPGDPAWEAAYAAVFGAQ